MITNSFKNFPTTLYKVKIKLHSDTIEILEFELLNHGNNTQYSKDDFDISFIEKNIIGCFKNFASILKNKNQFDIKYQFKDKNNKIHTFKDILKVIEKNGNIYTLMGIGIDISKEEELSQIFNKIIDSNHMGIVIYKEKIIFYDNYVKNLFEIDSSIKELSLLEIFPEEIKSNISQIIQKRFQGKKFNKFYTFELPTFKNNRRYIELYGSTILYEGEYAGFVIILDKTKFFKNKKMLELMKNVNSILLLQIFDKNILLKEIVSQINAINFFKNVYINDNPSNKENTFSLKISDKYIIFEAKYDDDFDDLIKNTLKEIQKNIEKTFKEITKNLTLMILKEALEQSFQWLLITDEEGKIIYTNNAVSNISGFEKEDILGQKLDIFKASTNDSLLNHFNQTSKTDIIYEKLSENKNKNSEIFYLKSKIIPIYLPNGKKYFVCMGIDLTKQKKLEKKITNIKFIDNITDLSNRNGLIILGNGKIKPDLLYSLIIIDIKDFKAINEIKGNKFGNNLLKEFANILKIYFNNDNIIARIGSDEFAVLMPIKNKENLTQKIKNFISKIKNLEINSLKLSINLGIALYPVDSKDIEDLIEKALIALQLAKKNGEYTYEFYNKNLSKELSEKIYIKNLIHKALKEDKFIYFFQPEFDSKTLKIASAESLIRIIDNNKIIEPSLFIDYAEESGIIKEIELKMAQKAVKILEEIPIPLSFNLSANSLKDSTHLNKLLEITKDFSDKIIIEITERELLFNTKEIIEIFEKLKKLKYKIAIDDFGTGYSSFKYIKTIPVDYLKIDISFIKNIQYNKKDFAIVDTIINFSKKLNIFTIAEGVENKTQMQILQKLGCDYLQGYYFSKPIKYEKLKKLISS